MRELVFALRYEPGFNPVADVLAEAPGARIRSLSCHVTADRLWRVDHATGPDEALDGLAETVADAAYYTDCLVRRDCEGDWNARVLDRSAETLVLYSYWTRTPACVSIPHLALEHLGDGLIFETTWTNRRYEWRIITPGDREFAEFYAAIADEIDDTIGVEFVRVTGSPETPDRGSAAETGPLTPEQDAALRAAVEAGYYETPRAIETYELADRLGVPGSTLSYRLRRAEAALAESYVAGRSDPNRR